METVTWVLFENLPVLAAILFTANFVLLAYWRRSGRVKPLLVGLTVAVFLLIVQALVVTRREHAMQILAGIEKDVVASRTEALAEALAPNFRAHGMGRADFLAYVEQQYEHRSVRSVKCTSLRMVRSEPDTFVVAAAYQVDLRDSEYGGVFPTGWEIVFVRTAAGWQISGVRPTYIANIREPGWEIGDVP